MTTVELGNIKLEIDRIATEKFYKSQNGFICDCPDCVNYVSKISDVQSELKGIEKQLGIDLTKDVGQGMDELMPHDYDNHHLYVIPYYVIGKSYLNEKELDKENSGPIWRNTKRAEKNNHTKIAHTNQFPYCSSPTFNKPLSIIKKTEPTKKTTKCQNNLLF